MFQRGDLITNGMSAGKVIGPETVRGVSGMRISNIGLERFGGNRGMSQHVPDHVLASWRTLPLTWSPVVGGTLEERYVWSSDYSHMTRELRQMINSAI